MPEFRAGKLRVYALSFFLHAFLSFISPGR
jgi:hypothetical protein